LRGDGSVRRSDTRFWPAGAVGQNAHFPHSPHRRV